MTLLYFILSCYGLTMILVYGKIFDNIRPKNGFFGKLLKCEMCVGFWVGIFNSLLISLPINWFIAACISSGTSYLLSKIVDDDGIAIKNK